MRTVAAGTISQALIDTQSDVSKIPYIRIYINSVDYSSRLLYLEHHEEPYRERATIGLSNRDGTFDDLDLDGEEFEIGYGYDTTDHGGSATDYVPTATLWVKSHSIISVQGERIYQIYAEGMWSLLRVMKVLPGVTVWKASMSVVADQRINPTVPNGHVYISSAVGTTDTTEPTWPLLGGVLDNDVFWTEDGISSPYSNIFNATHTVEEIIKLVVESMGWTWTPVVSGDSIVNVFKPIFVIGSGGYESGAAIIYRLIWMTYMYMRAKPSKTFELVYPQETDPVDVTYYSAQAPFFTEYDKQSKLLEPNSIIVLCNADPSTGELNTEGYPVMTGVASDTDQIAKYVEIVEPFIDGSIREQLDATNRAEAILARLKQEISGGRVLLPFHDCQVELYDFVKIVDTRI
ncbi:MAG: hypothetical protein WC364_05675 [Eubacteriales bacterium]|jgi:hypothetical protein